MGAMLPQYDPRSAYNNVRTLRDKIRQHWTSCDDIFWNTGCCSAELYLVTWHLTRVELIVKTSLEVRLNMIHWHQAASLTVRYSVWRWQEMVPTTLFQVAVSVKNSGGFNIRSSQWCKLVLVGSCPQIPPGSARRSVVPQGPHPSQLAWHWAVICSAPLLQHCYSHTLLTQEPRHHWSHLLLLLLGKCRYLMLWQ